MARMIIDELLPHSVASLVRHTIVDAPPEVTYAAIARTDALGDPLVRALFRLRFAPQRIAARVQGKEAPEAVPPSMAFGDVLDHAEGFRPLGEDPPHEVLSGLIGKLWQKDFGMRRFASAEEFRDFSEPGYAKTVADFSVRAYGDSRSLLSYESRTATTDEEAASKFRRYWLALKPGIAYVMASALRLIKAEAERGAGSAPAAAPAGEPGKVGEELRHG
jgi:hypothetical protein